MVQTLVVSNVLMDNSIIVNNRIFVLMKKTLNASKEILVVLLVFNVEEGTM